LIRQRDFIADFAAFAATCNERRSKIKNSASAPWALGRRLSHRPFTARSSLNPSRQRTVRRLTCLEFLGAGPRMADEDRQVNENSPIHNYTMSAAFPKSSLLRWRNSAWPLPLGQGPGNFRHRHPLLDLRWRIRRGSFPRATLMSMMVATTCFQRVRDGHRRPFGACIFCSRLPENPPRSWIGTTISRHPNKGVVSFHCSNLPRLSSRSKMDFRNQSRRRRRQGKHLRPSSGQSVPARFTYFRVSTDDSMAGFAPTWRRPF